MLVALNVIATAQTHATTTTMGEIVWLLNYTATQPDATLHYHASDMILRVANDASYLCEERARRQSGRHFFLAGRLVNNGNKTPTLSTNNGAIHTLYKIIKTVMPSSAEAKISATFLNAKDAFTNLHNSRGARTSPTPHSDASRYQHIRGGFKR